MSATLTRRICCDLWLPLCLRVALALLMLLPAPLAWAQTAPGADDLRALLYYFDASDTAATDAELRRLRAQFPQWTPPADLSTLRATGGGPQLDQIYRRIEAGDVAGARAAIAAAQSSFPSWSPPDELQRLLRTTEDQIALDTTLSQGNLGQALDLIRANSELLRCNRINNAWRLAELQISAGNPAAALGTYRAVVATCPAFADVTSTLEKARLAASDAEFSVLLNAARQRFPNQAAALNALGAKLLNQSSVSPTASPTVPAAPTPAAPPKASAAPPTPSRPAPAPAASVAVPMAVVPPVATGLGVLARSGDGRLSAVRAAAKAGSFTDCVAKSVRPKSLEVAYERAWCVYNLDRTMEALALFGAVASGMRDATVVRDARFGMALAYTKLGMTEDAARLSAATPFTAEQRQDIEAIILDQRGVRAYQRQEFKRAIAFFDALEGLQGTLRRDLAILRAYSYLELGERGTAKGLFSALHRQLATDETRRGMAASQ